MIELWVRYYRLGETDIGKFTDLLSMSINYFDVKYWCYPPEVGK